MNRLSWVAAILASLIISSTVNASTIKQDHDLADHGNQLNRPASHSSNLANNPHADLLTDWYSMKVKDKQETEDHAYTWQIDESENRHLTGLNFFDKLNLHQSNHPLNLGDSRISDGYSYDYERKYCLNQAPPVPLPAAGWLFLTGFIGIIAVARQK